MVIVCVELKMVWCAVGLLVGRGGWRWDRMVGGWISEWVDELVGGWVAGGVGGCGGGSGGSECACALVCEWRWW